MILEADDAVNIVLDNIKPLGMERISIFESLNRVIGEEIISRRNLPPYDTSAMDGYAIKAEDTKNNGCTLKVKGVIAAGDNVSGLSINNGECYRIMTGAFLPMGADSVIQHELTDNGKETVNIGQEVKHGFCVRYKGEDLKTGDIINRIGERFSPYHIGRYISAGIFYTSVYRKPRIALISTGNEIADPSIQDKPDMIFDSNSQMASQFFTQLGADVSYIGVVEDSAEAILNTFKTLKNYDMIVTSAGISAGDFDYMNLIADELGIKWLFSRINQKPGQHMSFGFMGETPVFACPGNPVSAMFCNFYYVKPALQKMMGLKEYRNKPVSVILGADVIKKKGRVQFDRVKVVIENGKLKAYPFTTQDSHIIESLVSANAYAKFTNEMVGTVAQGTELDAYIFNAEQVFG